MANFSDYIVFVDESGDHSMSSIDETYPVFVLACCLISKRDYMNVVVPAVQRIKFATFGHDAVVLHERDIRKDLGPFSVLRDEQKKRAFLDVLTDVIEQTPMTVFATVVDKRRLRDRRRDENPYEVSLRFCLERIFFCLRKNGQVEDDHGPLVTHTLCEARGRNEDNQLELAFRRICAGDNFNGAAFPFEPVIVHKRANAIGLQLADLVARPIGVRHLRPTQANRAWEVIERKMERDRQGDITGYGLKRFP